MIIKLANDLANGLQKEINERNKMVTYGMGAAAAFGANELIDDSSLLQNVRSVRTKRPYAETKRVKLLKGGTLALSAGLAVPAIYHGVKHRNLNKQNKTLSAQQMQMQKQANELAAGKNKKHNDPKKWYEPRMVASEDWNKHQTKKTLMAAGGAAGVIGLGALANHVIN